MAGGGASVGASNAAAGSQRTAGGIQKEGKGQLKINAHTAGRLGPPRSPPDKEAMSVL